MERTLLGLSSSAITSPKLLLLPAPRGMTLPLQSPLGLIQVTSAAATTHDSGFFIPLSSSSLNSQHSGLAQGGTPSISDKLVNELKKVEPRMVINAANIHHLWVHVQWASALLAPCQPHAMSGPGEEPGRIQEPTNNSPDPTQFGGIAQHGPQKIASHPFHSSEGDLSLWENIPEKQSASFWDNTSNTTSPSTKPQTQPHNTDVWACKPSKERLLSTQWPPLPQSITGPWGQAPQQSETHLLCLAPIHKKRKTGRKDLCRGLLVHPCKQQG